ncbi:magnesium transporter MgtC [Niabella ginsenosidivorans]|uniref:Magnesium transporter MgtC n=1 Tax=Niabella ginsenosidivorans TaxID=1176587 RepID=A0A1A9I1A5_9BACT|nr:MgtC/SapB family protein [Niabella ginsenosidivorans]ANH80344.1 magnesium transporter MgtC [Niabella ginsenosidivorans]
MITTNEIMIRLLLAALCGGVIGLERERKNWAAGLRTHMMVCLGASLTMIVSAFGFADIVGTNGVTLDPSRVAAQVISGIGFIGAGTILFLKEGVIKGLTTAAGLWTVAAIGLAIGGGMYYAAGTATFLALIILWMLKPVEIKLTERFAQLGLKITIANREKSIDILNRIFCQPDLEISNFSVIEKENDIIISFRFNNHKKNLVLDMIDQFKTDKDIKSIVWNK